jgi:hypothetical protein
MRSAASCSAASVQGKVSGLGGGGGGNKVETLVESLKCVFLPVTAKFPPWPYFSTSFLPPTLVASCPTEVSCWAVTFTSGKLAVMTLGT